jgi:hypothetical protein
MKRESKKAEETSRKNWCKIICEPGSNLGRGPSAEFLRFFRRERNAGHQLANIDSHGGERKILEQKSERSTFARFFRALLAKEGKQTRYFLRLSTLLFAHQPSLIYETAEYNKRH